MRQPRKLRQRFPGRVALLGILDCAAEIDGGGWKLVRHAPAGNRWHKATDQLKGSDVYGNPSVGLTGNTEWSIRFDTTPFTEFLFATGDCQKWLISAKDQVNGGYYSNVPRTILKSSTRATNYTAAWYNRQGVKEDPWISLTDHKAAISQGNILYGGNHYGSTHATAVYQGANVYIRDTGTGKP